MSNDAAATLKDALRRRFGEDIPVDPSISGLD
jgi:hypothetical protein